jgi:superfamily II DNA or RNA helicase
MVMFNANDFVRSKRFGLGQVMVDAGTSVVVRFEHGIEQCLSSELVSQPGPAQAIEAEIWHSPLEVVTRVQAECIQSVNETWGVFSLSRIALLPHQLWVCRKVLESWPTRWLVADDVGLGKTIEAGLILWPLLSRGTVKRLLVLCPASLVEQWQVRLRTMFDIRLAHYTPDADTAKAEFWHTSQLVVASLQTLRTDNRGRHQRMLDAPPWDLLVVDEAHHLNSDEEKGATLGYQLVEELVKHRKLDSAVFFTGTPHRGKNYGFLNLLKLLRPEVFDPKKPLHEQLPRLRDVMIRNNKQCVTDLHGNRLFQVPRVTSETFQFSAQEEFFYELLTTFISTGQAYASKLTATDQRMVILVLIAMQKLASSSVSAIRRALKRRLKRIEESRGKLEKLQAQRSRLSEELTQVQEAEESADFDALSVLEEQIAEQETQLLLMEDEEPRLKLLVAAAEGVQHETKIEKILSLLAGPFAGRTVLFFTEYKATQALLMSALVQKFGDDCVTFINGDEAIDGVIDSRGQSRRLVVPREDAASRFNSGLVRFLVSTEAAGEGIDLQGNCHTLIHVDLPWNPMRLHQRVGRLNRYGQTKVVEVVSLRNLNTVESRIWEKLTTKLDRITTAMQQVMAEPEDLQQLVLGMTSASFFHELFVEGATVKPESMDQWFDRKTATFGGRDVLETVRDLVGHSARFDFQEISAKLPMVDLPALKPFLASSLTLHGKNVSDEPGGLRFNTPKAWQDDFRVLPSYDRVVFSRETAPGRSDSTVLGVGHVLMEHALKDARDLPVSVTSFPRSLWPNPVFVFRIADRLTSTGATVRSVFAGIEAMSDGTFEALLDWQLLDRLNSLLARRPLSRTEPPLRPSDFQRCHELLSPAHGYLESVSRMWELPFRSPESTWFALFWPGS